MDNLERLFQISANDALNEKQKISRIIDFINRQNVAIENNQLVFLPDPPDSLQSRSIVYPTSESFDNHKFTERIYHRIEQERINRIIIDAVNGIPLSRSRLLFIQHYIMHYNQVRLQTENYLSKNAVYNALKLGEHEFLAHL